MATSRCMTLAVWWTRAGLLGDVALLPEHQCQARLGADTPEFAEYYVGHFSNCTMNYTGTPGGMEVAAAESLWERPVDRHGFRYTAVHCPLRRRLKHVQAAE